jgi:hypothetical protein
MYVIEYEDATEYTHPKLSNWLIMSHFMEPKVQHTVFTTAEHWNLFWAN